MIALLEARELQGLRHVDEPRFVDMRLPARLEEQRDVEDGDGLPCGLSLCEVLLHGRADHGMCRCVEPALLGGIGKGNLADAAAVELAVRPDDACAEVRAIRLVERAARLHELVRDGVSIDDGCPEAAQDGRGRALAARDAARQTDAFHGAPPLLKNKNQTMDKMIVAGNCKKMMKVSPAKSFSLALTIRTEMRASAADGGLLDRPAADGARLARAVVDKEVLLMVAGFARAVAVIAEGRAAVCNAFAQDLPDGFCQAPALLRAQAARRAARVNPREEQGFVGVDVAEPGDAALIEQEGLDGLLPALDGGGEIR